MFDATAPRRRWRVWTHHRDGSVIQVQNCRTGENLSTTGQVAAAALLLIQERAERDT